MLLWVGTMMPDQHSNSNNSIKLVTFIYLPTTPAPPSPEMRASSVLAASASLLPLAQARIFGVGIPSAIKPGDTFDLDLVIETQDYIQSVTDVSIAVGYSLGAAPAADGLGIFITAFDLGKQGGLPMWEGMDTPWC